MAIEDIVDSRRGYFEAQLHKLALDSVVTPAGIFLCEADNQVLKGFVGWRPASFVAVFVCPLNANEFTMPTRNHSVDTASDLRFSMSGNAPVI